MKPNESEAPLCKCGCGQKVKWSKWDKRWNVYIDSTHYYNEPGIIDVVRSRSLELYKKRPEILEQRKRVMLKYYETHPEVREINREQTKTIYKRNPEKRTAFADRMRKYYSDPSIRDVKRLAMLKYYKEHPERCKIERQRGLAYWDSSRREVERQRMLKYYKEHPLAGRAFCERMTRYWSNPEKGCPNKLESYLDELTPSSIKFVGNGSYWVTFLNGRHKNPDFVVEEQKKVVELYGDYWHKDDDPNELVELFKQIDYDCLVIWERELRNDPESTVSRVLQFVAERS